VGVWSPELETVNITQSDERNTYLFDTAIQNYPSKISKLLEIIGARERVFIYSNLEWEYSGAIISACLNQSGVEHVVLMKDTLEEDIAVFNDGGVNVCIAYSGLVEGYTLKNCCTLVLMEPVEYAVGQQVGGRIRRIGSLEGVAAEKRVITFMTLQSKLEPKVGSLAVNKTIQILQLIQREFKNDPRQKISYWATWLLIEAIKIYYTGGTALSQMYKRLRVTMRSLPFRLQSSVYSGDYNEVDFNDSASATADETIQRQLMHEQAQVQKIIHEVRLNNVQTSPIKRLKHCSVDCTPWPEYDVDDSDSCARFNAKHINPPKK
jgi:hypothetical protein